MARHGEKRRACVFAVAALVCAACTDHRSEARASHGEPSASRESSGGPLLDSVRRRFKDGDEPVISAAAGTAVADVDLPKHAAGSTRLRDRATGMSIAFTLLDARGGSRSDVDDIAVFERAGPEASDVFMRRTDAGVEDFFAFERRSDREELRYLVDVGTVAGLRLIGNVLEFLDAGGAPRLRMDPPRLVDSRGAAHDARVALEDCSADRDPRGPWGRSVTAPGRDRCVVRVDWRSKVVPPSYPLLVDPTWTATANTMTAARSGHTATLLANGKVLIVGGQRPNGATTTYLATTELFDPATNTFAAAAPMAAARSLHVAVLLSSGDVLVAGGAGVSGALLATAELYDGAAFRTVGVLQAARAEASAVELSNGKVLIAGGIAGTTVLQTAELFDTTTEKWTFTKGNMANRRFGHFVTKVPSGQGFVFGGTSLAAATLVVGSSEYYSPASDVFSAGSGLGTARRHFGAALMNDNRILAAGGLTGAGAEIASAEIYDPNTASWSPAGNLLHARGRAPVSVLTNGAAVVTGGVATQAGARTFLKSAELYDATSKAWVALPDLGTARADHTSTALSGSKLLVTGGSTSATAVTATAEVLSLDQNGAACKSALTCVSKQCVDGVCCESACATKCYGCANASTGLANGTCGPARAGKDPQGSCKDDGAPACGQNGFCDGSGGCAKYAATPCTSSACTASEDCTSGNCVDGVCCDKPCSGACEACSAGKKGSGASGTCGPVATGTDPDSECGQMGTAPCDGNATCDGAGACRVPNTGKGCATAICSDAVTLSEAATCSAAGECSATKKSCSPYRCDAAACKTSCATAADCAPGGTCVGGACNLKDDGETCGGDGECTSNYCVDGVCCDTGCTAQCAACDATGSKGKCTAIAGAPHGNREACTGTAPCVGTCDGKLKDTCAYPPTTVSCGPEVGCADGGTTEQKCNGHGECVNLPTERCAPYACSAGACETSCEKDGDCAFGYRCEEQSCVLPNASSCPDGGQSCPPPPAAAAGDEGGCGCRVGSERGGSVGWVVALLCGGVLARRRRQRIIRYRRQGVRQPSG